MKNPNKGNLLNNSIDKLSGVTFKDWDWNMIEKFDISCSYTYRCTQWATINTSKLKLEKIEVEKDFSYEYFWFLVVCLLNVIVPCLFCWITCSSQLVGVLLGNKSDRIKSWVEGLNG